MLCGRDSGRRRVLVLDDARSVASASKDRKNESNSRSNASGTPIDKISMAV